jgi:xanthine dehydrogenase molybdenum-binding subunit
MAIGKNVPRVDAVAKVTGRARYTDDFHMPGMLHAGYVRSPIAHGRVTRIDTAKAAALPGVEAVFTFQDVPEIPFATAGHPYSLDPAHADVADRLLLTDHVRYHGDEVAVVVARDRLALKAAIAEVAVAYEEYPVIVEGADALAEGAFEIHAGSDNRIGESGYRNGPDLDAALAEAPIRVQGHYRTQIAQHCHIENHIALAYMDDLDTITIITSTQIPHIARRIVGQALDLPWGQIRVIKPYIGGGFGAKQDVVLEPMVAWLTGKLDGRPVKIDLSREECMVGTRVRHPFDVELRAGADTDGRLVAMDLEVISNSGAYASHGHSVAAAGGGKMRSLYPKALVRYHAQTVYANIPAAGAMRAYGSPQVLFAVECAVEEAARKCGLDPLEFRLKNVVRPGDKDSLTGNPFLSCGLVECLERGRELIGWDAKRAELAKGQTGPKRRGLGVACFSYASGTYPVCLEIAGARLILNQDGSVHVQVGATEIGQGSDTVVAQMAAETLGLPFDKVHVVSTQDTDVAPFDTGAYASRQAYVVSNAVKRAAEELKAKILAQAQFMTGIDSAVLELSGGAVVYAEDQERRVMPLADLALAAYYDKDHGGGQLTADVSLKTRTNAPTFGCTFTEIEVDIPLCKIEIREIYNIHDSGRILHPLMAAGQVQGGAAMGIGAALFEELLVDPHSGRIFNNNLLDYKFPTPVDLPEIGCAFVETVEPTSGYGNKSLGEPPLISPPAAIRNALWDATGVKIDTLPLTPHRLFRHFKKAGLI